MSACTHRIARSSIFVKIISTKRNRGVWRVSRVASSSITGKRASNRTNHSALCLRRFHTRNQARQGCVVCGCIRNRVSRRCVAQNLESSSGRHGRRPTHPPKVASLRSDVSRPVKGGRQRFSTGAGSPLYSRPPAGRTFRRRLVLLLERLRVKRRNLALPVR